MCINKIKKIILKKKYQYFLKYVQKFDLKNNLIKWVKISEEESKNKIIKIDYQIKEYIRKFRKYSYIDVNFKRRKVIKKKEEINLDALNEDLETLKKEKNTIKPNLLLNNDLMSQIKNTKQIVFACEAGIGSSAMGASIVKKMLSNIGIKKINVINKALKDLNDNDTLVITQENFKKFVEKNNPKSYVYPN